MVTDAAGQTIAQAHHTPSLLAGFEITMRELVKTYRPEDLAPGDVIVTNDPYRGCQHIMDLYAIAPAFHGGELVGFVGNITHHTDLGGVAAGGVAGGIREIYLEGLRLPMVKLLKRGVEDKELFAHHRQSDPRPGQDAGRHSGAGLLADGRRRPARPSVPQVRQEHRAAGVRDLLDYSERRMRLGLRNIPAGTYEATTSSTMTASTTSRSGSPSSSRSRTIAPSSISPTPIRRPRAIPTRPSPTPTPPSTT